MSQTRFAALHGGLLVRKGDAAPAAMALPHARDGMAVIRPVENLDDWDIAAVPLTRPRDQVPATRAPASHEDPHEASMASPCCNAANDQTWPAHDDAGGNGPYRVTIRLTGEQRRRLTTASAQLGVTGAVLAGRALEAYLDQLAENDLKGCACMRRKTV